MNVEHLDAVLGLERQDASAFQVGAPPLPPQPPAPQAAASQCAEVYGGTGRGQGCPVITLRSQVPRLGDALQCCWAGSPVSAPSSAARLLALAGPGWGLLSAGIQPGPHCWHRPAAAAAIPLHRGGPLPVHLGHRWQPASGGVWRRAGTGGARQQSRCQPVAASGGLPGIQATRTAWHGPMPQPRPSANCLQHRKLPIFPAGPLSSPPPLPTHLPPLPTRSRTWWSWCRRRA